jgi:hypothetical protein
MKKAEMFDIYEQRYGKIQKWFSSGRFMEDFLREFEKNCQTRFGKKEDDLKRFIRILIVLSLLLLLGMCRQTAAAAPVDLRKGRHPHAHQGRR